MKEIETYDMKQKGTILLNANELYTNISNEIKKEIVDELSQLSFNRYPDQSNAKLIQAYSSYQSLECSQVLAGNGSDEMLGLLVAYFLGKDKTLYTLAPDFSMYDYYASMHEANIVKFTCNEDGSFDMDAFIERGRRSCVQMILFSNPNNPTGHMVSNQQLIRLVEAFPTIPVVIDEAYGEFANDSMITHINRYSNLYVTRTLSKAFGLAGMRLGFLMSNKNNIKELQRVMVPYNISSLTQLVGCIVLRHASEYEQITKEVIQARDMLYDKVKNFQHMTFYPSQANYLYGRCQQKDQLMKLFENNDVTIRTYTDDTFRITIGSKEENDMVFQIVDTFEKEVTI